MTVVTDWRLDNVKQLEGLRFQLKPYARWSDSWTHDHCAACWATSAETGDALHEGYATCDDYKHGANYDWICPSCFAELKDAMRWSEAAPGAIR